ncbi:MAG: type II toxin-antitoxin system HicB family antitoxin [Lachnospiraceae bacterium]|nr:type II toxin-antitoxin system HicB family antitoxin [Lachnospiraceae bacterium]
MCNLYKVLRIFFFLERIFSETHRQAAIYAIEHNQSLNSFIEDAVKEKLLLVRN